MRPPVGVVACLGGHGRDDSVHRRKACGLAALAAMAATASVWTMVGPLTAQTAKVWPTKRVQIIVPFSPGSATDLLPRTVFEHVAANVGQTIIIENRPGGAGPSASAPLPRRIRTAIRSWSIPTRW